MKQFAGIALLFAVVLTTAVLLFQNKGQKTEGASGAIPSTQTVGKTLVSPGSAIKIKGLIGGEKTNFLKDPEVTKILHERYGIDLDIDRRGSLEMVRETQPANRDFLWPSSQVALDLYKSSGKPMVRNEVLLNSPMVVYSWGPVADVLIKQKIVQKRGNIYYITDFPKLVKGANSGQTWKQWGMPQLYGHVVIYSTDPVLSNSGNMFAGLLANVLNGGAVVTEATLPKVAPQVRKFFEAQGYMEQSSDVIFRQFLNKGMGDKPLMVGYEAQMIEFSLEPEGRFAKRAQEVRTLYPEPTVWSSHPLIALTANGAKLIDALQDKDIQRIAWERHGFRSATDATTDATTLKVTGIPTTIDNVVPMPRFHVMEQLLKRLQ